MIARPFAVPRASTLLLCALLAIATASTTAFGQFGQGPIPGLDPYASAGNTERITVSAEVTDGNRPGEALMRVTAEPTEGFHTYSTTQPPGGPRATTITVIDTPAVVAVGEFLADHPFEVARSEDYPGIDLEEYHHAVTWTAPISLAPGVDLETLVLPVEVKLQTCDPNGCMPHTFEPTVKYVAPVVEEKVLLEGADRGEGFTIPDDVGTISGYVEPATAVPGQVVEVTIVMDLAEGWHVYKGRVLDDGEEIGKPTLIVVTDSTGHYTSRAVTSAEEHEAEPIIDEIPPDVYYTGEVVWTLKIKVPDEYEGDTYSLEGLLGYQNCTETSCNRPSGVSFSVELPVGEEAESESSPLTFGEPVDYTEVSDAAQQRADKDWPMLELPVGYEDTVAEIPWYEIDAATLLPQLGFALLGGLILNLMPCVLPVIGLKIFAFAKQGGEKRSKVFMLNLWYSIGILAVFMILATLAAFLSYGWGELYTKTPFKVGMAGLVFAMALAFLGVWEIPIPGFMGSSKANELQQKEGIEGAFLKGVFTTLLATPCSGPFLGPVFAYSLTQSALTSYLIFGCIGLGMASPYLIIGAFPHLVRFLPKPGAWMETFKQLLAFLLLGTVVYLLSTISEEYFIPTMTLLVGLWFACWIVGRTPITADLNNKVAAWATALAVAIAVGYIGFTQFGPSPYELEWQPFTAAKLSDEEIKDKTVLLDFTADWCLTCKTNSRLAINTRNVKHVVEQNGIVPLLADWTDESDEIKQVLARYGSQSIPLLVVLPAGEHDQPIVLRDLISEGQVLSALQEAGPSAGIEEDPSAEGEDSTAMLSGERTE